MRKNHLCSPAMIWCMGFLLLFSMTAHFAWRHKSATYDEPLHFVGAWNQTHFGDFRCNPEDPPLWKYYVAAFTNPDDMPVDLSGLHSQTFYSDFLYHGDPRTNADALLEAGRTRMIFLGVLLGILIAWWAWRLAGPIAAMIAVSAFSLDPNFLAHAPLIKNDAPITLVFVALMASVWLLGERATFARWLMMSLLLGAALTTKYSGMLAIPFLGLAMTIRALAPQSWRVLRWTFATRAHRLAAAVAMGIGSLLVSYLIIWACYGFRFTATADPRIRAGLGGVTSLLARQQEIARHGYPLVIKNSQLDEWTRDWKPDFTHRTVQAVYDAHLLPEIYLVGFVYTRATSLTRPTFLLGQMSRAGWWYYFPLAMSFKTPLCTLIGFIWVCGLGIWKWSRIKLSGVRSFAGTNYWPLCAAAVAPLVYLAVAMSSHLNLGIRHVLPVYPFLYILLGVVAAGVWKRRRKFARPIICVLLLGLAVETFGVFPDYIPFFNIAAGGSSNGLNLLSDSNIDWGQELADLADWQRENPGRPLYLSYFGTADPAYYGIRYTKMAGAYNAAVGNASPSFQQPLYAISAINLQGQYQSENERALYEPFRRRKPRIVLGGSLYLFDQP